MTEQEWLECESPMAMMNFLIEQEETEHRGWRGWLPSLLTARLSNTSRKQSNRRKYLLACGMLRQWLALNPKEDLGNGHVKFSKDLQIEEEFADGLVSLETLLSTNPERRWHWDNPWHLVSNVTRQMMFPPLGANENRHIQSTVFRHIIGNPFRPYPPTKNWPATVVKLADALYNGQDCGFALHDALLEAGHPELADHFRQEQNHPKGCWVLDLILGKE